MLKNVKMIVKTAETFSFVVHSCVDVASTAADRKRQRFNLDLIVFFSFLFTIILGSTRAQTILPSLFLGLRVLMAS